MLTTASDWQVRVDLKKRLQFPEEIVQTTLGQDIVIWSMADTQVTLIELTFPWEERIETVYERKKTMYNKLSFDCQNKGWNEWCTPVKIGCL